MKSILITILSCMLFVQANAQAGSVKVINKTDCRGYFKFYGDVNPSCGGAYTASGWFAVPPGGTSTYWPAVIYLSPTDYMNYAFVIPQPSCATPFAFYVGEICSGKPLSTPYYYGRDNSCAYCATQMKATWTPASTPGDQATLTFEY